MNRRRQEHEPLKDDHRRNSGIFAGVVLVMLGLMMLLSVLGVFHFSAWHIAKYWPIGLILIGIAIILRARWLTVVLIILTVLFCTAFFAASAFNPIHGSGDTTSRQYDTGEFSNIRLNVPAEIHLLQGPTNVTIIGDDNILDIVEAKMIDNDTVVIQYKDGFKFWNVWDGNGLEIYITAPDIESIVLDGAGDIASSGQISGDGLDLELNGAGDIELDVAVDELDIDVSGFGDLELRGTAERLDIQVSGASDIDASKLEVKDAKVQISGTGDVSLNVMETLDVDISGAGDVEYKGNPRVTQKISGVGDIEHTD